MNESLQMNEFIRLMNSPWWMNPPRWMNSPRCIYPDEWNHPDELIHPDGWIHLYEWNHPDKWIHQDKWIFTDENIYPDKWFYTDESIHPDDWINWDEIFCDTGRMDGRKDISVPIVPRRSHRDWKVANSEVLWNLFHKLKFILSQNLWNNIHKHFKTFTFKNVCKFSKLLTENFDELQWHIWSSKLSHAPISHMSASMCWTVSWAPKHQRKQQVTNAVLNPLGSIW